MADNKYELRDREVQEIMRKPPPAFIARGNVMILVVLGAAFYILNGFTIFEKETIRFEIAAAAALDGRPDSTRIALVLNDGISKKVEQDQSAKLFINNLNVYPNGYLNGRIDSIGYTVYGAPVIYFKSDQGGLVSKKGMIGHIDIVIKKRTFLSMLCERFRI